MSKMRTLKDMEFEKELRQEEIKWVKELNRFKGHSMDKEGNLLDDEYWDFRDSGAGEYCDLTYGNVINWIEHFFNITKKELEEK